MRRLPGELSQAAVRDAVRQLVDDERFPDAVRGHRPSIDAAPAPEDVVATLAGFA
jgi:hypothetical protein